MTYDLRELDDEDDKDKIFFKSRWIKEKSVVNDNGTTKTAVIEDQIISTDGTGLSPVNGPPDL